jgi:thioesterase domain-containing protein/NAD(P)-dependent dehydrogenase (short-subunit alcohol dehydrogenase family)
VRRDATYLLTGGLGGLGLAAARWLVERGAHHLVLLGRTGLPPRAEWPALEGAANRLARQTTALRELEALGARVHVAAQDVGDQGRLTALLAALAADGWPAVRGAVHAAGIADPTPALELDLATLEAIQRAKVDGGLALHRALPAATLDWLVFFSSAASVLPSPGRSGYAAGNAFLDALAWYRRAHGAHALSVNWGLWAEVGLIEKWGALEQRGSGAISPLIGLDLLERMLREDRTQVAVLPIDWDEWREAYPVYSSRMLFSALDTNVPSRREGREATPPADQPPALDHTALLVAEPDERRAILERWLREQLGLVLRIPASAFDLDKPLVAFGLDSLMAMDLHNRLERELRVPVKVIELIAGLSLSRLAAQLGDRLAEPPATLRSRVAVPSASPLVTLQAGAPGRRPIFLVHPAGGSVLCYRQLPPHLGAEQPVHTLEAPALRGRRTPHKDVMAMAAEYATAVRAAQPEGPYALAGWSSGGVVAFEMAQQLRAAGEEVALLAMFDSLAPSVSPAMDDAALVAWFVCDLLGGGIAVTAEELAGLGRGEHLPAALRRVRAAGALPAGIKDAEVRRHFSVFRASFDAVRAYVPRPWPGEVLLFTATEVLFQSISDPLLGWGALATLERRSLPGNHYSLLTPPNVHEIARTLAARLGGRRDS